VTTKPLTILQVLPALDGGGVEKGTLEIARFLVQQGHRSLVVAAGGRLVEQLVAEGSEFIQADIGAKQLSTVRCIFRFRRLLQTLRPDIVHARSRLPAWVCHLARQTLPKSERPHWVTTFHGQHSVNRYSAIMASGERVITVSDYMRGHILKAYPAVDQDKITVIHRGVDSTLYNPVYRPDEAWLQRWFEHYPHTRDTALLTLPGRLTRRKGIEDFIQIMAGLCRAKAAVHGLIVGEAHPRQAAYRQELQNLISAHGLDQHVTLTGHRSDLHNILALSSAVLSLSKAPEAFGRTTLEALSLGIPVIGYDHGGVAEQLNVLYPEGKVAVGDIGQALGVLEKLLAGGMRPVKANTAFTLDDMCAKTVAVYQSLT